MEITSKLIDLNFNYLHFKLIIFHIDFNFNQKLSFIIINHFHCCFSQFDFESQFKNEVIEKNYFLYLITSNFYESRNLNSKYFAFGIFTY